VRLWVPAEALAGGRARVAGDDHHYLFRVRRLAVGDRLTAFDGEGAEADATVEAVAADEAWLALGPARREPPPGLHLTVLQAAIKGDRMDWCVQKLVEVGVDRVVVVQTARTVVRLEGERLASRQARLAAIARDAARQARRATVPPVELLGLDAALALPADLRLVFHPAAARPLREWLGAPACAAALLVGPEGGLDGAELERATRAGFEPASLGATVLRAETAGVAAVAALRLCK
jgi:16S rRNA (uracil1498-N3)-methyltransferase